MFLLLFVLVKLYLLILNVTSFSHGARSKTLKVRILSA